MKRMRIAITTICIISTTIISNCSPQNTANFNSTHSYQDIQYQLSLGPRTIGSSAHQQVISWASKELASAGWAVEQQIVDWSGNQLDNIIATRNIGSPWIILGAHYDSRFYADRDPVPEKQSLPVPGANDGASGVAVLLELARVIPADLEKEIWIVLFDAEDNGDIPGWDWILGSRAFAAKLGSNPDAVVVVDMIGDKDLDIYMEWNSNPQLNDQIWGIAEELGYPQFIPEYKYQILDDHIPFIEENIPSVDIIDFDYPYWHTSQDTIEQVTEESLDAVGEVLLAWLLR
jgi:glutaminyl-peptide cyclotransferase